MAPWNGSIVKRTLLTDCPFAFQLIQCNFWISAGISDVFTLLLSVWVSNFDRALQFRFDETVPNCDQNLLFLEIVESWFASSVPVGHRFHSKYSSNDDVIELIE